MYKKLKGQIQKDRDQGAEKLKAALDSIKDEREQNLAKVVSRKDLPREPINSKAKTIYSYNSGKTGSKSGNKLSLLEKIRKEARDARLARINQPTSQLIKRPTEVKQAPPGLVEDYKRVALQSSPASLPSKPHSISRSPRPPLAISRQEKPVVDDSFLEREERLRALTGGRPTRAATELDSSITRTDNQSKRPTPAQPLSSRPKKHLPQIDGVDDEDVPDTELSEICDGPQSHTAGNANSPPKQRTGTPPLSRFGSPDRRPKRKAEPSIFMSGKKPKVTR